MTLVDDLKAAKALIANPADWGRWTGTFYVPGKERKPCALEALRIVEGGGAISHRDLRGYRALADALPPGSKYRDFDGPGVPYVGGYNDDETTTHADIMALFDRAIAAAEASAS